MKRTGRVDLLNEFKRLKKIIQRSLRQQHWQYVENLIVDEEHEHKPTKKFWSYKKSTRNEINGISPLKDGGQLIPMI